MLCIFALSLYIFPIFCYKSPFRTDYFFALWRIYYCLMLVLLSTSVLFLWGLWANFDSDLGWSEVLFRFSLFFGCYWFRSLVNFILSVCVLVLDALFKICPFQFCIWILDGIFCNFYSSCYCILSFSLYKISFVTDKYLLFYRSFPLFVFT